MSRSVAHVEALDLLRGLAALAVTLFHFTHANGDLLSADNPLKVLGTFGYLGVQVFFVISAFVIPYALHASGYTWRHAGTFLAKRVARIYPPYLVSMAAVIASFYAAAWMDLRPWPDLRADHLLAHLLYLNEWLDQSWLSDIYWTLAVEFQYYLLMAALFPLVAHVRKAYALAALGGFFAVDFVLEFGRHVFGFSLLFILGIVLFRFLVGLDDRRWFAGLATLTLAGIWHYYGAAYFGAALVAFAGILGVRRVPRPLVFLGTISYSLYLFHLSLGGALLDTMERVVEGEAVRTALVFVALAVSVGGAWLLYRWVEQPAMALSKRIRYRRLAAPPVAVAVSGGDGVALGVAVLAEPRRREPVEA